MLEHGVEDHKQLTHTGCEGHLLRIASGQQPPVEVTDDGVPATGHQRSHVQGGTNPGAPAPDSSFAPQGAAVPIQRSHSHQSGDLPVVQCAQLGQVSQEGEGDLLSNPGNGTQEVILLTRYGTLANRLSQVPVQVVELPLQPRDVGPDAGTDGDGGGGAEAVPLRAQHGHQLVSASDKRAE